MTGRKRGLLAAALCIAAIAMTTTVAAGDNDSGFKTSQAAMLDCPTCAEVTPLLTVGDRLQSGYRFESIPDGISVRANDRDSADLLVNHETSKVPFPYN